MKNLPVNLYVLLSLSFISILGGCKGSVDSHNTNNNSADMRQLIVLYFDGCPNTPKMIQSAQRAAKDLGQGWEVVTTDLQELDENDLRRGYGSPTLLLNGRDLFRAPTPTSSALSCRHYADGLPDERAIIAAIRRRVAE